ncbi:MAG: macro domain-containing protein [Pirellulales bacterium]
MNIVVHVGDILDHPADVLICTANPWLNMSGGVDGAVVARCGPIIQSELRDYLVSAGKPAVPAGTVVTTSAGSLPFRYIVHAVAIDPFYDTSIDLVRATMWNALECAASLDAASVVTPALGTGYGRLPMESFARALADVKPEHDFTVQDLTVILRRDEDARIVKTRLYEGS